MNTPNESTDPLRPAYPDAPGSGTSEGADQRSGASRRNLVMLVVLGIALLLVLFFLGRGPEQPADEPAPLPTTVE